MNPLTRFPKIPSDQITPLVAELLGTIQLQMEEIQFLKDEIARLKGQKPKPKIKPSNLEKKTKKKKSSKKKPKSRKRSKTKKLEIDEDIPVIAMATRITEQKGFDLILEIADALARLKMQLIIVGSADPQYRKKFRKVK